MRISKLISITAAIAVMGSSALYGGGRGGAMMVEFDQAYNMWAGEGAFSELKKNAEMTDPGVLENTAYGFEAGLNMSIGVENHKNTMIGAMAGQMFEAGENNTLVGAGAGQTGPGGSANTFVGAGAGHVSYMGVKNTFVGNHAGFENKDGSHNVFLGNNAGYGNVRGMYNVFLGNDAGYNEEGSHKLYIAQSNTSSPLIYGEFDNKLLRVNGTFETTLTESSTANNKNLIAVSRNNTGSGSSDAGFSLENVADGYKWTFRTYNPSEGFAASKIGTGGTEFEVGNTGIDLSTTVVKMGGVVVFEDGHLVNTSGDELAALVEEQSIKLAAQDKLLVETMAETEAMKIEAKAKDAEMIAMKAKNAIMEAKQEAQHIEIAQLKTMQKKVAMMESILTNLALNVSDADKSKVSINLK